MLTITYEILNRPGLHLGVKIENGYLYHVNKDGYCRATKENALRNPDRFANVDYDKANRKCTITKDINDFILKISESDKYGNSNKLNVDEFMDIYNRRMAELDDGDSLTHVKYHVDNTIEEMLDEVFPEELINEITNDMSKFVVAIDKPEFDRFTGNKKKNTFDIIRVSTRVNNIIPISELERKNIIKKNKKEIVQLVLDTLKEDRKYIKFNVPINCLKLSKMTYIRKPCGINFLFELKDELRNLESKL